VPLKEQAARGYRACEQAGRFDPIPGQPDAESGNVTGGQTMNEARQWEAIARFLWDLLDDIDTLDDACKDDDVLFRKSARDVHKRRYEVSDSDGYFVKFNVGMLQ
jgi:hypothetical protein